MSFRKAKRGIAPRLRINQQPNRENYESKNQNQLCRSKKRASF
jgi:hypothetical protein